MNSKYTTDITELKVKDFFTFQKALLTLTIGEGYGSLEDIIVKTMHLINKGKKGAAIQELNSVLTVISNIQNSESSIIDGLRALLKSGDIEQESYQSLVNKFMDLKKKSSMNS
jgi:hypothetical protein